MTDSPELHFVLAALRHDRDLAAVVAAASVVRDWTLVADLAVRHDVTWWVRRALPEGAPLQARQALEDASRAVAMAALAGAGELARLMRVLAAADVRAVAYKGPALAADVHGELAVRRFTDLDILVAEHDRDRAQGAMLAAGYRRPDGYRDAEARFYSTWEGVVHLQRDGELPVEVHWRCQAPRYGAPQDPAPVVARAVSCGVGGSQVLVPAPVDLAVLLALHGVKHAWTSLLWVVDFAEAVARPGFDWAGFEARAHEWGVARAAHDALLVAHSLLHSVVPPALLSRARADARAVRLADEAVSGLRTADVTPNASPNAGRESTARYDLQWLNGPWARARYLALAAVLPTPQERQLARLPDALLPLAYPLRAWRLARHAFGRRV